MTEIIIVKVNRIQKEEINMDALEVIFIVDKEERTECFDEYSYWMEEVNGEERFKARIRENVSKLVSLGDEFPEDKTIINELEEYKEEKI